MHVHTYMIMDTGMGMDVRVYRYASPAAGGAQHAITVSAEACST